jgi:hypothetical protein
MQTKPPRVHCVGFRVGTKQNRGLAVDAEVEFGQRFFYRMYQHHGTEEPHFVRLGWAKTMSRLMIAFRVVLCVRHVVAEKLVVAGLMDVHPIQHDA